MSIWLQYEDMYCWVKKCIYEQKYNQFINYLSMKTFFQQGGSPKGHKSVSKENVAYSGEAVFVPCQTPQHGSRPSTSATSSSFQVSSSSYESSASGTGEHLLLFGQNALNTPVKQHRLNLSRLMTKPTKCPLRQAKTQISLGICPVWSVFAVRMKIQGSLGP